MGDILRKIFVVPVILAGLGIVFLALSLLLLISKGNVRVLGAKLRVGALIIALQAIAVQGAWPSASREACYATASPTAQSVPEDLISAGDVFSREIRVNLNETNEITASLRDVSGIFTFRIMRKSSPGSESVQSGELIVVEGSPGETSGTGYRRVVMTLDPAKVSPGDYTLVILKNLARSGTDGSLFSAYRLVVVDE